MHLEVGPAGDVGEPGHLLALQRAGLEPGAGLADVGIDAHVDDRLQRAAESRLVDVGGEAPHHPRADESAGAVRGGVGGEADPSAEFTPADSGVIPQDPEDLSVDRIECNDFLSHTTESATRTEDNAARWPVH